MASSEAALYKMFSCQGGLNWIYGECTVKNVLLSRWFDLAQHGYGTIFLFGNKKGYQQNIRSKYMTLIQNKTENRLRRASGPVCYNHSVT